MMARFTKVVFAAALVCALCLPAVAAQSATDLTGKHWLQSSQNEKLAFFVWRIQYHRHRTADRPTTGNASLPVRHGMDKSFRQHQLDGYPEKTGRVVCRASGSGEPRSL